MVIEHLREDLQHGGIVLIAEAFNVDIEKNCLRRSLGRLVNQHESCRIIRKLLAEPLDRRNAVDGSVCDVEGETTSGVDMASDKGEYTVVPVTCNEDAKNYLVDNFNCSARKLTNWATILEVGKANGILFEK